MILPYNTWPIKSYKNESYLNFFTGVGGVLYKKEFLHKDIMNENIFMNICKDGDDIWFWGMAVLQGTKIKSLIPSFNELDYIEGSQEENVSLWHKNVNCGENDIKLNDFLTLYPEVLKKLITDYKKEQKQILIQRYTCPFFKNKESGKTDYYFFGIHILSKIKKRYEKKIIVLGLQMYKKTIHNNKKVVSIFGIPVYFSDK